MKVVCWQFTFKWNVSTYQWNLDAQFCTRYENSYCSVDWRGFMIHPEVNFFSPISERCKVVSTFGVKYSQFSINVKCDSNFNPIWIIILVSRHTGLHKLWYPSIRDTSTWSKFGAHGEHGYVFLFSNLGALWFSENLFRYSLHVCLRGCPFFT